ncbi:hypothetical protein [Mesobacillus zeae]|uniref:Uncharacterized protein n=1 Tax=Mesobacillus zeae TaxID=1917180 RepID=A0A398BC27_9BACI|nr:hypothetical protein [Mesobacillus zeae]RID85193.1 hypothetical protein D1970_10505 [Mesobacillus zeae]
MSEKLYFNLIKNVKKSVRKARKTGFFLAKKGEKREKRKEFILTAQNNEINPWKWLIDGISEGYFYVGNRDVVEIQGVLLADFGFVSDGEVEKGGAVLRIGFNRLA